MNSSYDTLALERDGMNPHQGVSPIIVIHPAKVRNALFLVAFALTILGAAACLRFSAYQMSAPFARTIQRFNVDAEQSIPTLFSTTLLLACSILCMFISRTESPQWKNRWRWSILSLMFLAMGIDEFCSFHELTIRHVARFIEPSGVFRWGWFIPATPLVVAVIVYYLPWVVRLPRKVRNGCFLACSLYIGGAIGMEMLGGIAKGLPAQPNLPYVACATIEELMEMAGAIVFIHTLLIMLALHREPYLFRFAIAVPTSQAQPAPTPLLSATKGENPPSLG